MEKKSKTGKPMMYCPHCKTDVVYTVKMSAQAVCTRCNIIIIPK